MAGDRALNYRITVDQASGTAGIRDFSRQASAELRKVDKSLGDTETASQRVAKALGQMADQAETELKAAGRAADALAAALGPEMAAKLGRNGIAQAVGDFNKMGLTFEQVEADADSLAASMKRLDDVQTSAAEQGLGNLSGKLNETEGAASGAKSALANMIGNTSQDVSGLAGNLGSLGVAIGQMGEYAADAALDGQGLTASLGSMAAVAAPIAGLALATQVLGQVMARFGDSTKRTAEDVDAWADAMTDGGDAAENYAKHLRDVGKITLDVTRTQSGLENVISELTSHWYTTGAGVEVLARLLGATNEETKDLTPTLAQAGLTAEQFARFVAAGADGVSKLTEVLAGTNLTAEQTADVLTLLGQRQADYATAAETSAAVTKVFGDEQAAAAAEARAAAEAANRVDVNMRKVEASTDKAARRTRDMEAAWDALTGKLDTDQALINLASQFDDVRTKAGEAWGAGVAGADDAEQKARDYQSALIDAKGDVINLGRQLGLSIPDVKKMLLEIDEGNMDQVERDLNVMARNRTMNLSIIARGGQGYSTRYNPDGSINVNPGMAPSPAGRGLAAAPDAAVASGAAAAEVPDVVFPVVVHTAGAAMPTNLTLDLRGAILGSRYDIVRTVRSATRDGMRLAGTRGNR
jgi:hypothetical protein